MPAGSAPGERRGGRGPGVPNRNAAALREAILSDGGDPAMALLRIARAAEEAGDLGLAADCYGKILPFIHARPRPIELEPDAVVDLERRVAAARLTAAANAIETSPGLSGLAERLARARARRDEYRLDVVEGTATFVSDAVTSSDGRQNPPVAIAE